MLQRSAIVVYFVVEIVSSLATGSKRFVSTSILNMMIDEDFLILFEVLCFCFVLFYFSKGPIFPLGDIFLFI